VLGSTLVSSRLLLLQDGRDSPTREYNNMASYAAPVTTQVVSSSQVGPAPWGGGEREGWQVFPQHIVSCRVS
jgi:hypothetical protein